MIKELLPQALGHTIARACTVLWSLSDSLEHEKILYLEKTDEQILYLEKTNLIVWNKTTLITGGAGGAGVDPPTCKMGIFFIISLTLFN